MAIIIIKMSYYKGYCMFDGTPSLMTDGRMTCCLMQWDPFLLFGSCAEIITGTTMKDMFRSSTFKVVVRHLYIVNYHMFVQ